MTEMKYRQKTDDASPLRAEERAAIREILRREELKILSGQQWSDRWKRMLAIVAGITAVVTMASTAWSFLAPILKRLLGW